ncbi:MAG: AlpA family transcriptional regulator [Woeseiaceae bacterium]
MTNIILRLPAVLDRTGLSRSTIYLMMSKYQFPSSISLGDRAVGWLEKDINEWIENKIAQSRKS